MRVSRRRRGTTVTWCLCAAGGVGMGKGAALLTLQSAIPRAKRPVLKVRPLRATHRRLCHHAAARSRGRGGVVSSTACR
jgi:hypothetical protein